MDAHTYLGYAWRQPRCRNYYYLEDVQWVQYFYQDYGFHGTYWHDNFGQLVSRGCVNMTNEDAERLFNWAFPHLSQWDGSRE